MIDYYIAGSFREFKCHARGLTIPNHRYLSSPERLLEIDPGNTRIVLVGNYEESPVFGSDEFHRYVQSGGRLIAQGALV